MAILRSVHWVPCAFLGVAIGASVIGSCGITVQGTQSPTPYAEYTYAPDYTPEEERTFDIVVDPTAMAFGPVEVGTSVTALVGYLNTGDETFHITGASLYTPTMFFAIAEMPAQSLGPNESTQVEVTFNPGQTGSYTATLSINTEDEGIPVVTVTGRGITEPPPVPTPDPTPGPTPDDTTPAP